MILRQTYWPDDKSVSRADKIARLLSSIDSAEKAVVVEVKRYQKRRSREAENYLWGVVYPLMSSASGYEKDELHQAMCAKFWGENVSKVMGLTISRPRRTTTTNEDGEKDVLSPADYWDFTDFVIREAAMWFDVVVPEPNPEMRKR